MRGRVFDPPEREFDSPEREFDSPEREGWCKERREVVLSWTPASCKLLGYPGYGWIRSIGSPSVDLIM